MRRRILSILLVVFLFCSGAYILAARAGSAGDPLITLSYLTEQFLPGIFEKAGTRAQELLAPIYAPFLQKVEEQEAAAESGAQSAAIANAISDKVIEKLKARGIDLTSAGFSAVTLKKGQIIGGDPGAGIVFRSGSGQVTGGPVIDITAGAERAAGSAAGVNIYYMIPSSGAGITVTSDTAVVSVGGPYAVSGAYSAKYLKYAEALKTLGLMKGTDKGTFDLERPATRAEALVMLIRLLGEEEQALACTAENPYADARGWMDRYVAYAHEKGYTNGTSPTAFSPQLDVRQDDYYTFLLRALGYSDAAGDFSWKSASTDAVARGIVSEEERSLIASAPFLRDQMALLSYRALSAALKNGSGVLAQALIEKDIFSAETFAAVYTLP